MNGARTPCFRTSLATPAVGSTVGATAALSQLAAAAAYLESDPADPDLLVV